MKSFNIINKKVKETYESQVFEIIANLDLKDFMSIPEFMQVIKYPGKMIRSTFTYITAYLAGKEYDSSLTELTIIIELIQAASLIHDDIIDNGVYRRGRKTIVNEYGLPSALLLGDCLIFIVMRLISKIETGENQKNEILNSISSCLLHMYEGQKSESILEGNYTISELDYIYVISNKTSIFFSMACELGTIIAGNSENYRAAVVSYGYNLGLAYQILDDLKSIIYLRNEGADKSYQTDLERRIVTLPTIVAYKIGNTPQKEIIQNFYSGKSSNKEQVIEIISQDIILSEVKDKIVYYIKKAKEDIKDLRKNEYKIALQEYCDCLLEGVQ